MKRPSLILMIAAIATGCASPTATAIHPPAAGTQAAHGPTMAATSHGLPAVGAPGYPANIYPAPASGGNPLPACPRSTGVEAFNPAAESVARAAEGRFETRSLAADLHASDRAWWPQIIADWRDHSAPVRSRVRILYAGLLTAAYPANLGAPDPRPWIAAACGKLLEHDSYVIASGPPDRPALQGESVFVDRDGHVLLYFEY